MPLFLHIEFHFFIQFQVFPPHHLHLPILVSYLEGRYYLLLMFSYG
jgi:hypothetical protein